MISYGIITGTEVIKMTEQKQPIYAYLDDDFNVHHTSSINYVDRFTHIHMHSMYELYMFVSGEAQFSVLGNQYDLKPGMIMFMRPGEVHSISKLNTNKTYERYSLHFNPGIWRENPEMCEFLNHLNKMPIGMGNCFYCMDEIDYFKKLFDEITNPENKRKKLCRTSLLTILPVMIYSIYTKSDCFVSAVDSTTDKLVNQIITYVNNRLFDDSWTLDDLAGSLYRDKAYINRRFKSVIGTGIWDYTIKKRIISIKQKMHLYHSVNEAFAESGFREYSTFFRNYVKITGNPPSDDIIKAK